jgi:CHAT domain-containing protein/Tfp pilus assembly protein PilF
LAGCKRRSAQNPSSFYNDGWQKLKHGDLNGARADADALRSMNLDPNTEWPSRSRILEAEILWRQGKNSESLALLEAPLPKQFATCEMSAWRKITQGAANSFLDRFDDSARLLEEAETLAKTGCPELLGEIALREGTLAFLRDDQVTARSKYSEALTAARNQSDPFLEAAALGNLGLVATKLEHYDEAIEWNRAALQLSQSTGSLGSKAVILGNIGWSYLEMGDYENALNLFQEADTASGKAGSISAQVDWKIGIGRAYYHRAQYDSASHAYQSALAQAKTIDYETAIAECFGNLALVGLKTGQVDSAHNYNLQMAEYARSHSDHYLELNSRLIAGRLDGMRKEFTRAEDSFESIVRDPEAPTPLKWEAQARLAEVYALEGRRSGAEREFRRSIETIARARSDIKREEFRLSFLSSAIAFYEDYIDFLISSGRIQDALQVAEISRAQALAEGLGLSSKISFPIPNFQPRLIAQRFGATLLFFWFGENHSYVWTITPSRVSLFPLPASSEIELVLKAYRQALLGPRDVLETSNEDGKKLYEILLAPAQSLIPPGSRVIILPDGGLYGLNFETLLNPKPRLHYWIEDAVVVNANSLVLLDASERQPAARTKKLLLVGNPISPSAEFPDLPQAGTEMTDVERYFAAPDRTVLSRQGATATAYLASKPAQYSFIHFVAHGTASRASPLDSAVILSKQGDSYKLYARDIVTQPLHANLVTISACHGAGERTYSGEGLVGLTWAFLRAGAHGVIAALWEVNDNSTPELMDDLYSEIQKGSAPDAALHHAKLKLLHSGTVYQKPFYWAPFEIYLGH